MAIGVTLGSAANAQLQLMETNVQPKVEIEVDTHGPETIRPTVNGFGGGGDLGGFGLQTPPNNDCADADDAGALGHGDSHTFTGNNEGATHDCADFPSGEGHVWISFELIEDSVVTLDYCGSGPPSFGNGWLNLAFDCPCSGFTPAAAFLGFICPDGNPILEWALLEAGVYYYPVMLDIGNDAAGDYVITVTVEAPVVPEPCIDGVGDCCSAQVGSPGCEDEACCTLICGQDAFCCNTNWDSLCAGAANNQCAVCQPDGCGAPNAGDCCSANPTPFCDDEECCELICAQDAFCCNTQWDSLCASDANAQCEVCAVDCDPDHDCCEAAPAGSGTLGCNDPDCCACICACDAFCCSTNWDSLCAGQGLGGCGASNPAGQCTEECSQCLPELECGSEIAGDCCSANSTPFCDDEECCELICAQDSFCCTNNWDSLCADAANDQCEVCATPCDPDHDCCEAAPPGSGTLGCNDPDCCECICACDSFCCATNWDSLCAGQGLGGCGASNPEGQCATECSQCLPEPEGCSLGFWKNHTEHWFGYDPDDVFDEVFGGEVPPDSDCCFANPPGAGMPGCDDPDCEAAVCGADAFCCNVNWDSLCANAANNTHCVELCSPTADPLGVFGDCTLHDVLSSPSGGPNACSDSSQANSLGKQAVAALLNAASVEYPLSESDVLDAVSAAFEAWLGGAHHDVLTELKDELDANNNLGCPEFNIADLNMDGSVDGADLLILLANWGPVAERDPQSEAADLNRDGSVDGSDLLKLLSNWGQHRPAWRTPVR